MTVNEILGKIIIEAMTVAIGVSIGTAQLGGKVSERVIQAEDTPSPTKFRRCIEGNGDFAGQIDRFVWCRPLCCQRGTDGRDYYDCY